MAFYKDPEEMFTARAEKYRDSGDEHWAEAKNDGDGAHYTYARNDYAESERNEDMARQSKGKSW